jgi:hypothetical protein
MSAIGGERTFEHRRSMSAFGVDALPVNQKNVNTADSRNVRLIDAEVYLDSCLYMTKPIPVVFCYDYKFMRFAAISIFSLLSNADAPVLPRLDRKDRQSELFASQ